MNFKLLFVLISILTSCCSVKKTKINTENSSILNKIVCPQEGECSVQIFKDKALIINSDNIKINYSLVDNPEKNVVQYQYKKNLKQSDVDGGYREEVLFEVDSNKSEKLIDQELQTVKMIFGRYCFCRGQTGLYKVVLGNLSFENKKEFNFELNFKINEVPQIINHITVHDGKL